MSHTTTSGTSVTNLAAEASAQAVHVQWLLHTFYQAENTLTLPLWSVDAIPKEHAKDPWQHPDFRRLVQQKLEGANKGYLCAEQWPADDPSLLQTWPTVRGQFRVTKYPLDTLPPGSDVLTVVH